MQAPFTQLTGAQLASAHITQTSVTGQSSLVWQAPSHTGRFSWQLRLASQYMMTVGARGQSAPVHGEQVSPHDLPSQGSSLVHESMPAWQVPLSQRDHGHALEPSGQSVHGARLRGQSSSTSHSAAQLGNELTQEPLMQSAEAQANEPSEHWMQESG